MSIVWHHRWRLLASLLVVGLIQRFTGWARAEEPQWFKLDGMPQASAGLELDGSSEDYRINGVNSSYDTLFITPTVGLRTSGSIYHPNLLAFDLDGELGWGWNQMSTSAPGYHQNINESEELNRYLAQINLLQEKPYNASFFASQDHTYRDYGSFDTFAVDSTRYGGRISWTTESLSLNADFGYRDEKDAGLTDSSEVAETYFNFIGINKRQYGQTTVTARWDMFDNILNFGSSLTTMNESVGISDSETFGHRKQITAATSLSVSHSEYSSQQTDTINATETVNINHTRTLDSYLSFDWEHDELHPSAEDNRVQGTYGIRHQLYESLTSNLDAHGNYDDNSAAGSESSIDRFGLGLYENYAKRLQSWGRLTLSGGVVADHEDDSSSGGVFTAIGETHQLYLSTSAQYRPVYLDRPKVLPGSIQVTAAGQQLVLGTDYEVISSGELTEVRLIVPPSSHLTSLLAGNDNLAVQVSYQSDSQNNASYETLNSNVQIRLDLPHGFGVYARMNWLDNNAPPQVLTQTLTDMIAGADYHWRWLRLGAEYEDYDSNFTKYDALRFYQNFDFSINSRSSLSFSFNETFYHYPANGDENNYEFIARYSVQLWSSVSWYVQGGCSLQDVLNTEQIQGAAQTGLNWTRGKLSVRAGYEYNTQSTSSSAFEETREKNRVFAYLKRTF